jgi:hypothetical protein
MSIIVCPSNSTSSLLSTSLAQCYCGKGQVGMNGASCTACTPGTTLCLSVCLSVVHIITINKYNNAQVNINQVKVQVHVRTVQLVRHHHGRLHHCHHVIYNQVIVYLVKNQSMVYVVTVA